MGRFDNFDISTLPKPELIEELNFEAYLGELVADLVARRPELDGIENIEGDLTHIILQVASSRELIVRGRVNDAARGNLLAFAGGGDQDHLGAFYSAARLPDETDEDFRSRIRLAIIGRSTAGPEERYEYIARSYDVRVKQARAYRSDVPGEIRVAILTSDNDGVADEALLAGLSIALNAPDVRSTNDTIVTEPAAWKGVPVTADIWLLPDTPQSVYDELPGKLADLWSITITMGRDVSLSWLQAALMQPGVQRVELAEPAADIEVDHNHAAVLGKVTLSLRGRDF